LIRYLKNKINFLKENNTSLNVVPKVGQTPDEDLIFCYGAKHFKSTGGGYGRLIQEFTKK
jgi:hypothetical protein